MARFIAVGHYCVVDATQFIIFLKHILAHGYSAATLPIEQQLKRVAQAYDTSITEILSLINWTSTINLIATHQQ